MDRQTRTQPEPMTDAELESARKVLKEFRVETREISAE